MIRALDGGMVPAAVIIIGKYLSSSEAAINAALYPAIELIDDKASMF